MSKRNFKKFWSPNGSSPSPTHTSGTSTNLRTSYLQPYTKIYQLSNSLNLPVPYLHTDMKGGWDSLAPFFFLILAHPTPTSPLPPLTHTTNPFLKHLRKDELSKHMNLVPSGVFWLCSYFSVKLLSCYNHMTSRWLQIRFFCQSGNMNWIAFVTSLFTLYGASFAHSHEYVFDQTWFTSLSIWLS